MTPAAVARQHSDTFAANRARGRIELAVDCYAGITRRTRVHESGSLRVRFPRNGCSALEAMLVNTAGGMAGGDNFELGISVGERAQIIVTTAAAEKVYRTLGPDTKVDVKIDVAANATLCWLPQETILFDRSRLIRRIEVDLAPTARMILAEALVFGRSGMGEVIELGALFDQWRIRRANRLIHAEGISLDGAVSDKLSFRPIANGGLAIATVLLVPGDDAVVAAIRAVDHLRGELGASSWNGLAIVRFCAADGNALRHDLMQVLASLGTTPLPALWIA